ncbi:hypothetical protein M569_17463, partial [Genlisea aurea]
LCIVVFFRLVAAALGSGEGGVLDSLLQDYAFRALVSPKTGTVYDGQPPSNLTGVGVSALRLRSGSLWRRGVSDYKEFHIPVGVAVHPYAERLVFVYQNLGNWSSSYYRLPGYTLLSPVLGLLAYDASNVSARNLPTLQIQATGSPISVSFADLPAGFSGISMRCAYFGLNGSVAFSAVLNATTCLTDSQGHFTIVIDSSLLVVPPPPPPPRRAPLAGRVWIIAGAVIGGAAVLAVVASGVCYLSACRRRKELRKMEAAAEVGVPLPMTSVGSTKAPVALETRTRPLIETEFVP